MKQQLVQLIDEGNMLKTTFTEDYTLGKGTNNPQAVTKWITKAMRIVENVERQQEKSPIYIKLSNVLKNGDLYSDGFEELVGIIEGINETYFEVDLNY